MKLPGVFFFQEITRDSFLFDLLSFVPESLGFFWEIINTFFSLRLQACLSGSESSPEASSRSGLGRPTPPGGEEEPQPRKYSGKSQQEEEFAQEEQDWTTGELRFQLSSFFSHQPML